MNPLRPLRLCERQEPLKVVHLITELNTGGAERMLHRVVTSIDRRKFRSIVVTMTDQGPMGEKIAAAGFPVIRLGMKPGMPSMSGARKLHRLLRTERVDILQTWLYHADLLGMIVGKISPVERIIWGLRCSDMEMRHYRPLTAVTLRACSLLSSWADAIIVNSEAGKKFHSLLGYPRAKMVTIPNGFDTDLFRPAPEARTWLRRELGIGKEAFLIGLVARFDPMKDHANFLRAAALLKSEEDVHYVLVGKGVDPRNRELAGNVSAQLQERVHLLGQREDISKIAPALDIATSSSAYGEGFSNTIGEAMACGVPCVATDVGDSARIVGDTGMVVPPRDPGALAGAWVSLLKMGQAGRKKLGARARARIVENYRIEKVVRQFEEFYERIIGMPGEKWQAAVNAIGWRTP